MYQQLKMFLIPLVAFVLCTHAVSAGLGSCRDYGVAGFPLFIEGKGQGSSVCPEIFGEADEITCDLYGDVGIRTDGTPSVYEGTASVQIDTTSRRYLIDLGAPWVKTPGNWNNVSGVQNEGMTINDLVDTDGNRGGISFSVVKDADGGYGNGSGYDNDGADQETYGYPVSAVRDSYLAHESSGLGEYVFTGLNPDYSYDLKVFASRKTNYLSRVGIYTVNGIQQRLDAKNNTTELLEFKSLTPSEDGSLTLHFKVADGFPFAHINVIDLEEKDLGGVSLVAPDGLTGQLVGSTSTTVRLNWRDNNSMEQGFLLERRVQEEGLFSVVDSLAANVTTYTDEGLSFATTYEYRMVAFDDTQFSEYSDTLSIRTGDRGFPVSENFSRTYLIDLGDGKYAMEGHWNNASDPQNNGQVVTGLVDSDGWGSGISFKVIDDADNGYYGGRGVLNINPVPTSLPYPSAAVQDAYIAWGKEENEKGGVYGLRGLNPRYRYDIKLYGYQKVAGTSIYRIGDDERSFNASGNQDSYVVFEDIVPDDGGGIDFYFGVKDKSSLAFLNVIEIKEHGAAFLAPPFHLKADLEEDRAGVFLQWENHALNADSLELFRSSENQLIFEHLATLDTMVQQWMDTTINENMTYYYTVRAVNGAGTSHYSNKAVVNTYAFGPELVGIGDTSVWVGDTLQLTARAENHYRVDPDNKKVVIMGSSTAYGTGPSSRERSWARHIERFLGQQDSDFQVINLARGGYTTKNLLPEGDPDRNITKAISENPSVIIINLPSNDVACIPCDIPDSTSINNLKTMYDMATAAGIKVFVTTTQPRNFWDYSMRLRLKNKADAIKTLFGNDAIVIYDELANPEDLNIKQIYNSGDGIHLNDRGHLYLYQMVLAKLEPLFRSFSVDFEILGLPGFVDFDEDLADGVRLTFTPELGDEGYYEGLKIIGVDGNGNKDSLQFSVEVLGEIEFLATMEGDRYDEEATHFANYAPRHRVSVPAFNHTDEEGAEGSFRLVGGFGAVEGLAKTLKLSPGHHVDMEVFVKCVSSTPQSKVSPSLVSLLGGLSGLTSTGISSLGEQVHEVGAGANWLGLVSKERKTDDEGRPNIALNYLLFGQDFQLLDAGFQRVSADAGTPFSKLMHQRLSLSVDIAEESYLYVYISNDSKRRDIEAYFDDFKIKVGSGRR